MSKYYAVVVGKKPGIYTSWTQVKPLVENHSGAIYKSFKTRQAAQAFMDRCVTLASKNTLYEVSQPDKYIVYTDGSYTDDETKGYGLVILEPCGKICSAYGRVSSHYLPLKSCQKSSNNIAELYAIQRALTLIPPGNTIIIYSDCNYAVTKLTDWPPLLQNNKAIPNRELIEEIYGKMIQNRVTLHHIPGHSGIKYNVEADRLAALGKNCKDDQMIVLSQ